MLSGAGEAVSRRRWSPLPVLLVFLTLCFMFRFFTEVPVRFSLTFGRRRSRRSPRRRRALWSSFVVFPVTLSLRLVSASAMSREGSLTTALCRFTATLSVEPTSGCRRTCHAVDSVQAYQPPKELSYQPTNSLFPSPGRPELDIPLWFAPSKSYDTRSVSFTRVNPSFIGSSSFSPPLKVKLLSPAWILSSDCTVHLRRILSGVLSSGTEVQCGSGASLSTPTARIDLPAQFVWAWPIWTTKLNSPNLILPKPRFFEGMIRPLLVFDGWVSLSDISGEYTENSSCCIMPYLSCGMILLVGSPGLVSISPSFSSEKCPLSPSLLSVKGDVFLVSLPSISFSFFTSLLSCGAVCTGPEDAIKITHVFLVGESWLSTSLVTISQLPDFVVKALSTQSSFVLISLSSSHEELSILTYFVRVVYVFILRGWLIPSVSCNRTS
ncbi:hypothetical protein IGI04_029485 [Brassica rapa subsp. trilocularis]|uniref:Uncharacterized protein n=1 Tax=Brassica rapa subsp. trilocularis TaxID=1813537 RepID=A0ABQ7LR73_BRACM|nr:hypothetical protein IGI04_029485 [Brassica rapa subsp. trilocularis]